MIIGIQIIAILFAFSMIYFALLNYRRHEIDRVEFTSWVLIWLATVLIVVFPDILRAFATQFLVARLFDIMVVGGFILVIFMVAKTYVRSKKTEQKLEELVRKEALKDIKKKDEK